MWNAYFAYVFAYKKKEEEISHLFYITRFFVYYFNYIYMCVYRQRDNNEIFERKQYKMRKSVNNTLESSSMIKLYSPMCKQLYRVCIYELHLKSFLFAFLLHRYYLKDMLLKFCCIGTKRDVFCVIAFNYMCNLFARHAVFDSEFEKTCRNAVFIFLKELCE